MTLTTRSRRTIVHEVTPPGDEDREVIVEEERFAGWTPSAESKDVEETPTRFRYKVAAAKGQTTKASLVLERVDNETVVLTTLAPEEMLARIRGLQNESAKLKDTVTRLAVIVADINKAKAQQRQLESEREKITGDQVRVRANLQAVGQSSDLGRRYIDTLKSRRSVSLRSRAPRLRLRARLPPRYARLKSLRSSSRCSCSPGDWRGPARSGLPIAGGSR